LSSKANFVTPPAVEAVTGMGTMPSNAAVALVTLCQVSVTTFSVKCSTVFPDAPGPTPSTVHLYRSSAPATVTPHTVAKRVLLG
jgi:hypothetical protein